MEKNNEGNQRIEDIKDYICNNWKPYRQNPLDNPKYMTTKQIHEEILKAIDIDFSLKKIAECMEDFGFVNVTKRVTYSTGIARHWVLY